MVKFYSASMRHSILVFILHVFTFQLIAQTNWSFDHISTDEGLSTGTANCVFKDSKGFIWIGTRDGLNRYDGYDIVVYKNDKNDPNSIAGNFINTIAEDAEGNIWIGTRNNGISIFDWEAEGFQDQDVVTGSTLPEGQIRFIRKTTDNQMLLGIDGEGILLYDANERTTSSFRNDGNSQGLSSNNILSIAPASESAFWITSTATQVDRFDVASRTFSHVAYDPQFEPDENTRKVVMQDSNNFLWIGTDGKGLLRINLRTNAQTLYSTTNSAISSNIITTLYEGQNGLIYVGTDGNGINVLDPTTDSFTYIQSSLLDPTSLSSNAIYQIYEDNSGVIWVSTFRGGVNTYSPLRTKFNVYRQIPFESNSLSFASVIDVFESSDGLIWIGTDGGGLDVLNPNTGRFNHYQHDPDDPYSISTNVAIAIEEDSNGYLWIGTYAGGVNRLDRNTGRFRRFLPDPEDPTSLNSKNVWHIIEDSEGVLWLGLLGGLERYDPATETFIHYNADGSENSLSSDLIFTLFEDSQSRFWIGTEDGGLNLMNRDSETFTQFKHADEDTTSILSNSIRTIFEDRKGQLWIGTSEGANIFDPGTQSFINAKVNALLPSVAVHGIQEDAAGNLWIATNSGISKYDPETNTIQNFGKSDGLQGNEFNYTSSTKTQDGTMYFGGVQGLNAFHPTDVRMSTFNPKVAITDIKLFDRSITRSSEDQVADQGLQALSELTLRHDQNVLEFNFASLDFTSPNSNQYRYLLEGFDKEWMYTDAKKRAASYTNLDAGDYTFIVEGTNSDGIWSTNNTTLHISVLPPWWATWWFRTLLFLVIASTIVIVARWRARTIQRQKEALKSQVEEAIAQTEAQNRILQAEQGNLEEAIAETNEVVGEALESGNFSARINLENKSGAWKELGQSINSLFDSIVLPFQSINEIVGAMASSNLTIRYTDEAKGDILKMTSSLNYALDNLSMLISTIRQTTSVIGQSSSEMLVSSDEMSVGTAEIAASTAQMSNGAQDQVGKIDEASNKLEEIVEFSSSAGDQAQSINQAAQKGVGLSKEGQDQMNSMDENMQKMEQASGETSDSIQELLTKSGEISGILNSIKEISVETNMLALNATIEAAKAGDSGRGFAVVADQIRRLAENSSQFATEIESIVSEVQSSISEVNQKMNEMSEDIKVSVSSSQNASRFFSELAGSYEETFNLSQRIVTITDEQFAKVKEVVHLMESVVVIAEESAAGTEQIASSANELSAGMVDYQDKTKNVSKIIELLNDKMNEFKLKEMADLTEQHEPSGS